MERIRSVVRKRLLDQPRIEAGMKQLNRMLLTLHEKGFVKLDPEPPARARPATASATGVEPRSTLTPRRRIATSARARTFRRLPAASPRRRRPSSTSCSSSAPCHPLYGAFLIDLLGIANREERIQAFESVLELPRPLLKYVRVPFDLPPGPLADREARPGADRHAG